MKITINNRDCSAEISARIADAIRRRGDTPAPVEVPPAIHALALREARNESEFQDLLTRLLRHRDHLDTMPFPIPHRGGWRGRIMVRIKQALWQLLRYQHDRITFRQNLINTMYSSAIEFERTLHRRELDALKARIEALEQDHAARSAR